MTDQPTNTTAVPAVEVQVIPAREAVYQGVKTIVPMTVLVDGKPVARCPDEAVAHLLAEVLKGDAALNAVAAAEQIADLKGQLADKDKRIADLESKVAELEGKNTEPAPLPDPAVTGHDPDAPPAVIMDTAPQAEKEG